MKLLLTVSIILCALCCFSQSNNDSLFSILKASREDTNKVNILITIAKNDIYDGELEKGEKSANTAMLLSKELNYQKGIGVCYQIYGRVREGRSDFNGAIDFYNSSLNILNPLHVNKELASVYGDLGNAYYLKGDLTKAIEYFLQALKLYELLNDKVSIAGFSGNIGIIYENIHDNSKALSFYQKALKINQEINSQQGIAINYVSIGVVYSNLRKEDEALDYFFKSLAINEKLGNYYYMWTALINISSSYEHKKDIEKSLLYAKQALDISKKSEDVDMRIRTQYRLASIYKNWGKTKLAEQYLLNNDSLLKTVSSLNLKSQNNVFLSDLYAQTGDYKKKHVLLQSSRCYKRFDAQ